MALTGRVQDCCGFAFRKQRGGSTTSQLHSRVIAVELPFSWEKWGDDSSRLSTLFPCRWRRVVEDLEIFVVLPSELNRHLMYVYILYIVSILIWQSTPLRNGLCLGGFEIKNFFNMQKGCIINWGGFTYWHSNICGGCRDRSLKIQWPFSLKWLIL